jgi:hypothetical protein
VPRRVRAVPRVRYQPLRVSVGNGHEAQAKRELLRKPRNPLVIRIARILRIPLLPRTAPPRGGPSHMHAVHHDDEHHEHHD